MEITDLTWWKCTGDAWCPFRDSDLDSVRDDYGEKAEGVYVIWHNGSNRGFPEVVRVGKGIIPDRLKEHRKDTKIVKHAERGKLFVTWAEVPDPLQTMVEAYLSHVYQPLIGKYPNYSPWMGKFDLPFERDQIPESA